MPAYGLHWLPTNRIYFDPLSNTVVVAEAWKSLVCIVDMARRFCFHELQKQMHGDFDELIKLHRLTSRFISL